ATDATQRQKSPYARFSASLAESRPELSSAWISGKNRRNNSEPGRRNEKVRSFPLAIGISSACSGTPEPPAADRDVDARRQAAVSAQQPGIRKRKIPNRMRSS